MVPQIGQPRRRFLDGRAGNKGARHMFDLDSDRLAAEPGTHTGGGERFESPVCPKRAVSPSTEVLARQR